MHLGQTATYLAKVMNRPEATLRVVSRLLREGDWVNKGPRGRNAPHMTADDLSNFILAIMAAPDSPAIGMDRLAHFRALPMEDDATGTRTLGQALALVLTRLADETGEEAERKNWRIVLAVDLSVAMIEEVVWKDDEPHQVAHHFSAMVHADPEEPVLNAMPYFSGMGIQVSMPWFTLFRIAKAVLANEPDPLPALAERLSAAS